MDHKLDFLNGEYLLIDKPSEWTSFDVVNKIRFILKHRAGIPKIKVGHTGTLDPLATGLLVICTGKLTKKINELSALEKEYTGIITLGATTPSYDLETEFDATYDYGHITPKSLEKARETFMGPGMQIPPPYSAKKIDGVRAYTLARENIEVKIEPRNIIIHEFELTKIELPHIHFRIRCSKGTYIRTIAYDFGKALGSGAHLSLLRRTAVGDFRIEDALSLEQLEYVVKLQGDTDQP
jgi:tRNA pseudouridine55 synthase